MNVSEKAWRVVLYVAAGVALVLGIVEAVREQRFATALPPGTPPPAFLAVKRAGGPFSLSEVQGKVTVLSFWATWCGPCLREMPVLQKLAAEYRDRGVSLVTANMDDADGREEAVAQWVRRSGQGEPLIVYPDSETARAWHALTLPTLYLLGRDGRILAGYSGGQSEQTLRRDLEAAISAP